MFLNLAIFLLVAAIVIAVMKPKSKAQVWIVCIITPIIFALIYGLSMVLLSGSSLPTGYQLGGSVGGNAPSILISAITLFFCLKKKLEEKDSYKYPKGIFAVIIVCAIIGCVQLYMTYQSRKTLEQYVEMKSEEKIDKSSKMKSTDNNEMDNPVTKKIHKEMLDAAQSYNEELPEDIGNGMTMLRCAIEDYSMVYTIQWKGLSPSDFTDDDVSEIKKSTIDGLKEEQKSALMKAMLNNMKDYGYDFIYRYVNENGEELCSINISPFEI